MATSLPPAPFLEDFVPNEMESSSNNNIITHMNEEDANSKKHQEEQRQEVEECQESVNADVEQQSTLANEVDDDEGEDEEDDDSPPSNFICPLTLEIMSDPLMTCKNHLNFERSAIVEWLNRGNTTCPLTRAPLSYSKLVPNAALRLQIEEWKRDHGIPITTLKSRKDKWNEAVGGKISFCLQNIGRNSNNGDSDDDDDGFDGDDTNGNSGFRLTIASSTPLTYHQQLFMVAALGQDYSLEERRQLMEDYNRSTGGLFYDDLDGSSDHRDENADDVPIATLIYGQDASATTSSRRRRRHHLQQHRHRHHGRNGGRRGGSSGSNSTNRPSSTRQSNVGNSNNNANTTSPIGISPRRRRRLLSVIDNALSMLRGTDAPNL